MRENKKLKQSEPCEIIPIDQKKGHRIPVFSKITSKEQLERDLKSWNETEEIRKKSNRYMLCIKTSDHNFTKKYVANITYE